MRDITDFSAKDSKAFSESRNLFENAAIQASDDILAFDEARQMNSAIPTSWSRKTHNSKDFLNEEAIARKKMNVHTNAVKELLESHKDELQENLKYGATPEELEAEVRGDFGREVLEVCQNHNITGTAIWDAIDILKAILGDEPNVDEAISSWGGSDDSDSDSSSEDDSTVEESTKKDFPKSLEEMTKILRHKIAEKKLRRRLESSRRYK